jgi:hypothetical protein
MAIQIQLRRGLLAEWRSANSVLAEGEIGLEKDTGNFKIGNGSTAWSDLSYPVNYVANNALYLNGVAANSYVQNTDSRTLSGNLNFTGTNNYFSSSVRVGANVTVNTSSYLVGNSTVNTNITSGSVSLSGAIVNSTIYTGSANNASYLGGVAAASYVNSSGSYTISGVHTHTANIILSNSMGVSANNSYGTDGQVLTSNGTTIYWSTVTSGGTFSNGQSISVSNLQITGSLFVNGASNSGSAGQVLTTNGTGVYWSTVSGVNVASQYAWTNTHSFSNVITFTSNVSVNGAIIAAGAAGSLGQVLTSSGGGNVYWSTVSGGGGTPSTVRQIYTANGTTNTFTVSAVYSANNLDVYLNGVKLQNGVEVTATNGTTFTIVTENPQNGSVIEVVGGLVTGITTASPYVTTTNSSITINPSVYNGYFYTALATDITINASTIGSPVNGTKMIFRFKDNGTARNISWTLWDSGPGGFRQIGTSLPGTTVVGKVTYVGCIYNATEQFWDVIAVATQT